MFGNIVGALELQVKTGSSPWTTAWSITSDHWQEAIVAMSPSVTQLQLRCTSSSSWSGDMAMDDITSVYSSVPVTTTTVVSTSGGASFTTSSTTKAVPVTTLSKTLHTTTTTTATTLGTSGMTGTRVITTTSATGTRVIITTRVLPTTVTGQRISSCLRSPAAWWTVVATDQGLPKCAWWHCNGCPECARPPSKCIPWCYQPPFGGWKVPLDVCAVP